MTLFFLNKKKMKLARWLPVGAFDSSHQAKLCDRGRYGVVFHTFLAMCDVLSKTTFQMVSLLTVSFDWSSSFKQLDLLAEVTFPVFK